LGIQGAFTGAIQAKQGLFEEAMEGPLSIDEISMILPSVRSSFLRVLQEKELMKWAQYRENQN